MYSRRYYGYSIIFNANIVNGSDFFQIILQLQQLYAFLCCSVTTAYQLHNLSDRFPAKLGIRSAMRCQRTLFFRKEAGSHIHLTFLPPLSCPITNKKTNSGLSLLKKSILLESCLRFCKLLCIQVEL